MSEKKRYENDTFTSNLVISMCIRYFYDNKNPNTEINNIYK